MNLWSKHGGDETLTVALPKIDYGAAFPEPDQQTSFVAVKNGKEVGQCSSQPTLRYWKNTERVSRHGLNSSTLAVFKIHDRVVELEKKHLEKIGETPEKSMRSAGIAVIPEERGYNIGKMMRNAQIEVTKKNGMTTLFSECTNTYSASTITPFAPEVVAEFPYKDLAIEISEPRLSTINDSFRVYCKKV